MVQQGLITINGYVGSDPASYGKDAPACSFRIGCTRRYFDAAAQQWKDRPTIWITVKAFRALAQNVLNSVRKGDPVIVTGSLANEQWERDGETHSRTVIEAASIGHDLGLGTSQFTRQKNVSADQAARTAQPAENQATTYDGSGRQMQSRPVDPYAAAPAGAQGAQGLQDTQGRQAAAEVYPPQEEEFTDDEI
ncbi:single-stranded DNA-binding protein [Bifidobacterium thermophilum]|uniref:single-stranded DNA-binding protein n=1 Tax=Bifidobacterium thermophilum TaxID=33905 RepID=UPI0030A8A13A